MDRLRIAIADDDARVRSYMVHLVELLGHQAASEAENGRQLVEQCLASAPDLIISDMQMPEMTGLEAVDQIWQWRPIPAILISGLSESELFAGRLPGRKPTYLMKPVRLYELEGAIRNATWRIAMSHEAAPFPGAARMSSAPRTSIHAANGPSRLTGPEAPKQGARPERNDAVSDRFRTRVSSALYPTAPAAKQASRSETR